VPPDRRPTPVKDRALGLLAVRSRSREELHRRLLRAGYGPEEVESTLADLERVGLIDDERFAREVAGHEFGRRGMGRRAVMSSLRQKGVPPDLAERTLDVIDPGDEEERALEVARARLARLGSLAPPMAYRRLLGFLQRRGYSASTAHAVCRRAFEERGTEG
jgi:regulatory protein